ncbi:Hypothetical predicted protein [Olea europaea subsp. europaea]|uniref:Pentatricopeptide repeat-containing protein n=1 Tax=Olea europaea subsp. europaea TaxID=158383 RepID=A0A8S0SSH8_OLEEU|nr:Hypothetical predicted protein [Olea europaea subsp. europaea]
MEEAGVTPDVMTYTTYVEGLCKHGWSDIGYEVSRALKAKNVPIDVHCYRVLIHGFVKEKKVKEADIILVDMEKEGLVPDKDCYRALIHVYCESGNTDKPRAYRNEMAVKRVKTDCVIVTLILQSLCQHDKAPEEVDEFKYLHILW